MALLKKEDQSQVLVIKVYHNDNGIFNNYGFMEELLKNQQKIRFSGDGDSHQNWVAEHTIKM